MAAQQLRASEIDTKLAPGQMCERLCLVKTSINADNAFTPGPDENDQIVSVNKLWPALKFSSYSELIDQLNKMDTDPRVIAKTKGRFVLAARKSVSNAGMALPESGFAYLLGKGNLSEKSLVPLAKNDSGELIEEGVIFDFFDAVIEMETAEGYCASPEFQNAFKNAMARIELEESGEDAMQVNVTTVNSAKKTMAEKQPMQGVEVVRKEASRRTSPRKKQAVPVETVEFTGNPSDTSSFGADLAGEQVDPAEKKSPKGKLTTSDADGLTDWNEMWKSMQDQGWTWVVGDGLVDWYYVHPKIAHLSKKTEIMKAGKEGEDYFISDESVMRYAKIHLGFRGRVETPVRNNDGQRRGRKRSAAVVATAEPIAPTKKEKKRNSKSNKKQADKTSKARKKLDGESKGKKTKIMMNSNRNEDVDDESHFSEGGKAFGPNSPSMSEAEANLGEQSAQKKLTYHSKQHNSTPETAEESSSSEIDYTETESESDGAETEISESDDNTFQVMSSTDAWKLLMDHFGFKYHKGMYCLPGSENKPGNESCAIEGRHYFSTLMELRKHLCAYGLPKCKKYLEYEGTMAISRWVRFAHVQGLADGAFVNPADLGGYLNFREAWTLLQKVGLTWSNGSYVVDGGNPLKEPRKFEQQEDMCVHLARFGIPQIPSSANIDLTEDDRLRLDLFLTGAKIDTLKRIDPDKENVNEITPRRSRSKRSSDAAESCKDAEGLLELSPKEHKQALGHRVYQTAFNSLEEKRQIDLSQIDAEKCKRLLVEYYNFSESTSYDPASAHYGDSYFCFPGVAPTEKFKLGVDFFESVQDMREYLCAYGLPPRAKRSRITDNDMAELEQWIRTAHMMSYDEYITTSSRMQPREVKNILKGLGYQFSRHFDFYLLPDTPCHKSQVGRDRFEQLIDLFNHIARFGLSSSEDGGVSSVAEMQRVQLFIASIATNDLSQQVDCREPLPNQKPITLVKTPSVAAKQSELDYNASEVEVKTPKHVPVVLDQDDTPESKHETPRKQKGILNYFAKTVADGVTSVVKAALTPSKNHSVQSNIEVNTSSQRYSNNELAESESNASRLENTPPPSVEETAMDEDAAMSGQDPAQLYNKKDAYSLSRSQIHLPWVELWKEMRSGGWRYVSGNELTVSYYYVHSHCAGMNKREVLRGKKGMDYFESEEEVQEFAKKHLGWKGEKVFSTPGETMMSSPVITSSTKRQRTLSQEEPSPSKKSRTARQHSGAKTLTTSPTPYIKAQSLANSKQNSTSSQASEPKKNLIPLPDQQLSYKDKLEYCKLTLHPSYKPKTERLASTSNSVVEQLEHEIKQFMKRAINTGYNIDGMSAPSPGFMYICGGPGTGKTTAVTACSQLLAKWSKEMGTAKPCYCQINMASNASKSTSEIQKEMLKDMAKKLEIDKKSPQDEFMSQFSKKGMILVVDEIDMLFKNRGGSGEEWFSTLIEWCEDEDLAFSMIGISNSVNDASAKKIRELGNSPHELVFPTYNEADLLAILKKRIGVKIVDIKALQLISKRVAASTGDARKVLEITSNAVDKALDACKEKWSDEVKDDCYPLVKLPQMMRAIREGMPTRHEEIIRGLPQAAKVILCIAVSLGKVWGPTAAISIATLKKYAVQATKRAMLDDASLGQISNLVEMLMDSGLLTTDHDGCFNFNAKDLSSRLHIGVQLDDVEIALEKTLLEESSFYRSLVDYVKREHPHPE